MFGIIIANKCLMMVCVAQQKIMTLKKKQRGRSCTNRPVPLLTWFLGDLSGCLRQTWRIRNLRRPRTRINLSDGLAAPTLSLERRWKAASVVAEPIRHLCLQGAPQFVKMQVIPNVKGKRSSILRSAALSRALRSAATLIVPITHWPKITIISRFSSTSKKIPIISSGFIR